MVQVGIAGTYLEDEIIIFLQKVLYTGNSGDSRGSSIVHLSRHKYEYIDTQLQVFVKNGNSPSSPA